MRKAFFVVAAVSAFLNFLYDWKKYGFRQSTGWMTAAILLTGVCWELFKDDL